jgi:hypothetical protein
MLFFAERINPIIEELRREVSGDNTGKMVNFSLIVRGSNEGW